MSVQRVQRRRVQFYRTTVNLTAEVIQKLNDLTARGTIKNLSAYVRERIVLEYAKIHNDR